MYYIELDNNKIGTTQLEFADPPMGVVFGKINFFEINSGYEYFRTYCMNSGVSITEDPLDKSVATLDISGLKVISEDHTVINGLSCSISGMDSEGYDIYILGIESELYSSEFPHHIIAYETRFNS